MAGRLTKVNKTSYLLTIPVHPYPDKLHPGYLGAPRASRNQATTRISELERAIVSRQHVMLMEAKLRDTVERNVER